VQRVSIPEPATVLRVLIVDDHRTFAELLALGLDSQADIRCVGHVQQAAGAADAVAALQPDVALVDVHLGQDDGLVLAADLHAQHPQLRIIALTASLDPVNIARAAKAGVCAYLPKAGALEEVLNAVRTARVGHLVLPPHMVLDLLAMDRSAPAEARPGRAAVLTAREQQVLEGLSEGMDVTAIAKRLGIRTSTCRGYVQNVLTKLGAHTQLEAVAQARSRGMLGREDSRTREP
jgi:DNA-binding NarL/FixJ family response regulator